MRHESLGSIGSMTIVTVLRADHERGWHDVVRHQHCPECIPLIKKANDGETLDSGGAA